MNHYEVNTKIEVKIRLVLIGIIICLIVSGGLYFSEGHIGKKSMADYSQYMKVYKEDNILTSFIDEINISPASIAIGGKNLVISGWIFENENSIDTYNCHVALEDTMQEIVYILPTMMLSREDVASYYDNIGYTDSGFYSKAKTYGIQLDNNRLEVIIIYENNGNKMYYYTGIYIENGEIVN